MNCSSDLKIFANLRPSALNFKSFSRSLEQFFLTVTIPYIFYLIHLIIAYFFQEWTKGKQFSMPIFAPNAEEALNLQKSELRRRQ